MSDRERERRQTITPVLKTGSQQLDAILPGEIMTVPLPQFVEESHVADMLVSARRRFGGNNGIWTVAATQISQFTPQARDAMRSAFVEFGKQGGKLVILICTSQNIINLFRLWVGPKQGLELRVVADYKEGMEVSRQHRGAPPKPAPPK